jgi:fluoride ion exporter CrcB/FEX
VTPRTTGREVILDVQLLMGKGMCGCLSTRPGLSIKRVVSWNQAQFVISALARSVLVSLLLSQPLLDGCFFSCGRNTVVGVGEADEGG